MGVLGGGEKSVLPSGYLQAEFLVLGAGDKFTTGFSPVGFTSFDLTIRGNGDSNSALYQGYKPLVCSEDNTFSFYYNTSNGWSYMYAPHLKVMGVYMIKKGAPWDETKQTLTVTQTHFITASGAEKWYEKKDFPANPITNGKLLFSTSKVAAVQIFGVRFFDGEKSLADFMPGITKDGKISFFDRVSRKIAITEAFNGVLGMTLKQARKLSKLPAGGGTLTVSLPWEALDDAKVQDALATAAKNGWTIVEQYREPEPTEENIAVDFLESTSTGNDNVASYFKLPINAKSPEDDLVIETEHFMAKTPSVLQIEGLGEDLCAYCIGYSVVSNSGFSAFDGVTNSDNGNVYRDVNIYFDWRFGEWANYKLELLKDAVRVSVNGEEKASFIPKWYKNSNTRKYLGCFGRFNNDSTYTTYGQYGRKRKYKAYVNGEKKYDLIPAISADGRPCFYNKVDGLNYFNAGASYFIAGFETAEAARRLAKLPKVESGELTVSLPAEARDAASMVPTAISIAVSRGWTIIEQYRED